MKAQAEFQQGLHTPGFGTAQMAHFSCDGTEHY